MVLAAGDSSALFFMGFYGLCVVAAFLEARRKHLSPVMHLVGILGLIGLIAVAVVSARCKDCKQPVSADELKRKACPRCQGPATFD